MFLPKLNSLLTGVFVAMIIAISGSVLAQDGLRLWKPYDPQSFGGGRRSNDGMYSSLSGIYWSISTPKDGYIGATTASGKVDTRWVYDGTKVYAQTNSVKINMLDPTTTLGTRFEVGNRRGHHGWLVSGYGLPNQSHRMNVQNMSMAIRDEGNLTLQPYVFMHPIGSWGGLEIVGPEGVYIWDRRHNSMYDPTAPQSSQHYPFAEWQFIDGQSTTSITGIGYLWGIYRHIAEEGAVAASAVLAPLPIWFADVNVNVSSSHLSTEVMYTYRAHPFAWGGMELLAGARYWDFDDKFSFFGSGPGGAGTGAVGNNVDAYGPVSILADMTINARGQNRVFGPQVGMKLSRHNARWSFGAEGRFMGGINSQIVRTEGYIAGNYNYGANNGDVMQPGDGHEASAATPQWVPIGLQYSNTNFGHKQTKTYFSPIVEFRLTADWQWTNAVSFFGAADAMFAGNIARGVRVTDYVVHSDGTIFGIRGNDRNTSVAVYGVEAGVKVMR
jgi:hypothetical protein